MSNRLYITNISYDASAYDLGRLFESIGPVTNASIAYNDGKSLGYGFVVLADEYTAQVACERFNNTELFGRPIRVSIAKVNNGRGAANYFQGNEHGNYGGNEGWYDDDQRERERDNFGGGYVYNRGGYGGDRGGYNRGGGYGGYRGAWRGGGGFHPRIIDENTPRSETQIHVKNLEYSSTVDELRNAFEGFDIREVIIPNDILGHSYGFGLVDFTTHDEQLRALARGPFTLHGREVVLSVAFIRQPRTATASATTTAASSAPRSEPEANTGTSGSNDTFAGADVSASSSVGSGTGTDAGADDGTGADIDTLHDTTATNSSANIGTDSGAAEPESATAPVSGENAD